MCTRSPPKTSSPRLSHKRASLRVCSGSSREQSGYSSSAGRNEEALRLGRSHPEIIAEPGLRVPLSTPHESKTIGIESPVRLKGLIGCVRWHVLTKRHMTVRVANRPKSGEELRNFTKPGMQDIRSTAGGGRHNTFLPTTVNSHECFEVGRDALLCCVRARS